MIPTRWFIKLLTINWSTNKLTWIEPLYSQQSNLISQLLLVLLTHKERFGSDSTIHIASQELISLHVHTLTPHLCAVTKEDKKCEWMGRYTHNGVTRTLECLNEGRFSIKCSPTNNYPHPLILATTTTTWLHETSSSCSLNFLRELSSPKQWLVKLVVVI